MKFKVFKDEKEEKEKTVYFKLNNKGGCVELFVCNSEGKNMDKGHILTVYPQNKEIYVYYGIDTSIFNRIRVPDDLEKV